MVEMKEAEKLKQKQTSFQDNVEIDLHLKASSTA